MSSDALEVDCLLHVGNDFTQVKLEELVKQSKVRYEGNGTSDIADD